MRRKIDIGAILDEDRDYLLNCAHDLGAFIGQAAVQLICKVVAPPREKYEYHPDQEFPIGWVSKHLGVSRQTVRNRIREGHLRAIKTLEGQYRFRWRDILAFQENNNGNHHES